MSRVMHSAHEECPGDAACDQGDGPCIAWLRDRIDADAALLEECREALLARPSGGGVCQLTEDEHLLLAQLNERLEVK